MDTNQIEEQLRELSSRICAIEERLVDIDGKIERLDWGGDILWRFPSRAEGEWVHQKIDPAARKTGKKTGNFEEM